MKNLMNLKGAKVLNRVEQKSINGGSPSQYNCEQDGGEWVCIGTEGGWPEACGCVFDGPVDPPIQ